MNEYRKGYNFERRVRIYLEKLGYIVFRAAGSKPIDLIVTNGKKTFIIECKVDKSYVRKRDINRLIEYHNKTGYLPIIAYRKNRKIIFYNVLLNKDIYFPKIS